MTSPVEKLTNVSKGAFIDSAAQLRRSVDRTGGTSRKLGNTERSTRAPPPILFVIAFVSFVGSVSQRIGKVCRRAVNAIDGVSNRLRQFDVIR